MNTNTNTKRTHTNENGETIMSNGYPPPPYPGAPAPGYAPPAPAPAYPVAPQGYPPYTPPTTAAPQGYPQPAPQGYPPAAPQGYPQPAPQGYPPAAPQGYPPPGYSAPHQGHAAPGPVPGYGRPNIMSGLGDVDPTGSRLPHFNANHRYLVRNDKIEFFQGRSEAFVASEWHILESDDQLLPPGRDAKYMIKWGQDMSQPNFKGMCGALEGLTDQDEIKRVITEAKGLDAVDPQKQPYRGRVLELRTTGTTTKRGSPFTVHNWTPAGVIGAPASFGGANPASVTPGGQYAPHGASGYAPPAQPPQQAPGYAPPGYAPPAQAHAAPPNGAPFPPAGWFPHPAAPGSYHNGKVTVIEAELRAMQAQGRA